MDKQISVLIADDNAELCNLLKEYIDNSGDMAVLGIARDGLATVNMIRSLEPDVVVLDLIMPGLDGIGVLERLEGTFLRKKPIIIVLSSVSQDVFIQKVIDLGAEYYMIKPFDVAVLVMRIRQLCNEIYTMQHTAVAKQIWQQSVEQPGKLPGKPSRQPSGDTNDLRMIVTSLIQKMGIAPNLAGYGYLREVVMLCLEKPETGRATKELYPKVATLHGITQRKVDRAIRNAIDNAVKMSLCIGENADNPFIDFIKTKPTNGKIIAMLAERAKIELKKQQ